MPSARGGCERKQSGATGPHLLQSSQLEAPQTPAFLDLTVHRFHNRFALGVDPRSLLALLFAGHEDLALAFFGSGPRVGGNFCPSGSLLVEATRGGRF